MIKTHARAPLITSQSVPAGNTVAGVADCVAVDGGMITFRITNGATGPTTQMVAQVLVAHFQTPAPTAGAEGVGDLAWKIVHEVGGGTAANATTRGSYIFGPEVAHIQIRMGGHTGQAVTPEAHLTTYNY